MLEDFLNFNDSDSRLVQAVIDRIVTTLSPEGKLKTAGFEEKLSDHLAAPEDEIFSCSEVTGLLVYHSAGILIADIAKKYTGVKTVSTGRSTMTTWIQLPFPGENTLVPSELAFFFPANTISEHPVAVAIKDRYDSYSVKVYIKDEFKVEAQKILDSLITSARGESNFYRGKTIHASVSADKNLLELTPLELPDITADSLFFPEKIWKIIDTNVYNFFESSELLSKLSDTCNRGIVFAGPPGTGKTDINHLIMKTLKEKYNSEITIIYCDYKALSQGFSWLYGDIASIGKTVIVLEDIDLFLADRDSFFSKTSLLEFLTSLDGIGSKHSNVLTLATTNNLEAIDKAAKRPSRLDVIVEIPIPDLEIRAKILSRSLGKLGIDTDGVSIAKHTESATGANLLELVRQGVLTYGKELTVDNLVELAKDIYKDGADPRFVGNYI